jgi:predicted metal-dependent phosphoesterase TrpH
MKNIKRYQTLHSHTIASDGSLTHSEVIEQCRRNNISVVAFTDHDSLPSRKVINKIKKERNKGVDWIIGIEISSGGPKDFKTEFTPHIVGLFIDPFDTQLVNHCKLAQEARIERMSEIVEHLVELGFDITKDECLKASGGESVTRPHIVSALKTKPQNLKIIENLRLKMERASKKDSKVKVKYDQMMDRGEQQYPYVLFLSGDSFYSGVYVDYKYRADLDKSVELIRKAGGIALFAHWFTEIKKFNDKEMGKLLKDGRLDGAETVYGYDALEKEDWARQRKILEELLARHRKVAGGGVDAHHPEHFEWMGKNHWYSKYTIGMAEKMIKTSNVDTTWSSF